MNSGTFSKAKVPLESVTVDAEYDFVWSSTCAPGTEAPLESRTSPLTTVVCARVTLGINKINRITKDGGAEDGRAVT